MFDKKTEELMNQIENVRKQLNDLSKEKTLSAPEVIEISQKLDTLLNEFECLKNKNP